MHEPDFERHLLQNIPLTVSLISDFPRTPFDALVTFLQAVDRFWRGRDGCTHLDVVETLQALSTGPRRRPPCPPPSAPRPTALKLKSSSPYNSLHSHDRVDNAWRRNSNAPVWHTRDASFFYRFFPSVDGLPTPAAFPNEPQQDALVE
jgi:hypothetical protein